MKVNTATFGAGCFWCTEACFAELKGVISVQSGFSGGHVKNPSYEEVCTGNTGHAEVAQITYDADLLSFQKLLKVFWFIHDPTQLNRQGNDIGTHYRSAIFYHDEIQKKEAEACKKIMNEQNVWDQPVVTEISRFEDFYSAEAYHNSYLENNPGNMYCQAVVRPKLDRFKQVFASQIK
jgi:peptide-methionine (S)-S-oxide reductase